jgi:hypothetical protein
MRKVRKPVSIRLPDRYSWRVRPKPTVKVGTQINFEMTYQEGKAQDHQPSLDCYVIRKHTPRRRNAWARWTTWAASRL